MVNSWLIGLPILFRATFRDWAAERTNFPSEVVEMALAHAVGDKVEAAYRRGDLFEKRRRLMADWATYCNTPAASGRDKVVPMRARRSGEFAWGAERDRAPGRRPADPPLEVSIGGAESSRAPQPRARPHVLRQRPGDGG